MKSCKTKAPYFWNGFLSIQLDKTLVKRLENIRKEEGFEAYVQEKIALAKDLKKQDDNSQTSSLESMEHQLKFTDSLPKIYDLIMKQQYLEFRTQPIAYAFKLLEKDLMGRLKSKKTKVKSLKPSTQLMEGLRKVYEEKLYFDVVFKVEGQEIAANKALLAATCPYFYRIFTSGMMESTSKAIEVPEKKASTFNALLEYLYCGEINLSEDMAKDLLIISEEYSLPDLKITCEKFLIDRLRMDNVIELTTLAEIFGAKELEEEGIKFMGNTIDEVFETKKVKSLSDNILHKLYKLRK